MPFDASRFRADQPSLTGLCLALDLSSTVGWCLGERPDSLSFGFWPLPVIGGEGARGSAFARRLGDFLEEHAPRTVLLESPLPPVAQTHTRSARQQYGLTWATLTEAWDASAAVIEIDALSVRREVMGAGRLSRDVVKREVVLFCRRSGIKTTSHHAADAALLWLCHWQRVNGITPSAGPLWGAMA